MTVDGIHEQVVPHRGHGRLTARPVGLGRWLRPGDVLLLHEGWVVSNQIAAAAARRAHVPYLVMPHGVYESAWRTYLKQPVRVRERVERYLLDRSLAVHVFFESEIADIARLAPHASFITAPTGFSRAGRAMAGWRRLPLVGRPLRPDPQGPRRPRGRDGPAAAGASPARPPPRLRLPGRSGGPRASDRRARPRRLGRCRRRDHRAPRRPSSSAGPTATSIRRAGSRTGSPCSRTSPSASRASPRRRSTSPPTSAATMPPSWRRPTRAALPTGSWHSQRRRPTWAPVAGRWSNGASPGRRSSPSSLRRSRRWTVPARRPGADQYGFVGIPAALRSESFWAVVR